MSFTISAAAWSISLPGLRKLVCLALCDRADKTGRCWPSMDWIAKRCGISERAARAHVSALVQQGLIRREFRLGRSAVYFIAITPATAAAPADAPHADTPAIAAPISSQCPINKNNTEDAPAAAVADDVEKQLMKDWSAVRKAKRRGAPTSTELDALRSEGEKIGMGLSDVLKTCVIRGWTRFEAAWLPTPQPAAATVLVRPPEPAQAPARAETVSEGVSRLASLRTAIKSTVCATGNTSLAWAHTAIAKKHAGEYVAHAVVRQACNALRMDYRTAFS